MAANGNAMIDRREPCHMESDRRCIRGHQRWCPFRARMVGEWVWEARGPRKPRASPWAGELAAVGGGERRPARRR